MPAAVSRGVLAAAARSPERDLVRPLAPVGRVRGTEVGMDGHRLISFKPLLN